MPFSTPATAAQIRQFKQAANGLSGKIAGEAIVKAVLAAYNGEITVMDRHGLNELFRIGLGPRHGIDAIHVHPISFHGRTGESKAHKDPFDLMSADEFNMYVGTLLLSLETGCFRAGFKYR
jgi:hypothetical protein